MSNATGLDILFAETGGKTGITVNHKRIQNRDEADGLRNAWGEFLANIKGELEK